MEKMNEIISVKMEHIQELKARIAQIEDDVQKELERSQPEDWEVKIRLPRPNSKKCHTYYYIRKKNSRTNICNVYGSHEDGWKRSVLISQTPQMLSLIRQIAQGNNEFTDKAKSILEDVEPTNWLVASYDRDRCWNARILDRKKRNA